MSLVLIKLNLKRNALLNVLPWANLYALLLWDTHNFTCALTRCHYFSSDTFTTPTDLLLIDFFHMSICR